MSYSFSVKGTSKEEVVFAVIAELDKVVAQQPAHAIDRKPALDAVTAFLEVVPFDPSKDISVGVSGWLNWRPGSEPDSSVVTAANVSVGVSLVKREEKVAA